MSSAWDLLREFGGTDTFGHIDFSGVRAGLYRPLTSRGGSFPYDKDTDSPYGQPGHGPLDRGNSGNGPNSRPPTPMTTAHSAWDKFQEPEDQSQGDQEGQKKRDEAIGTPMSLARSSPGGQSSGPPGSGGGYGWSSSPSKPWETSDEKKGRYSGQETENDDLPESAPLIMNPETAKQQEDPSFDEVPGVVVPKAPVGDLKQLGSARPFMAGLGRSLAPGRGSYGMYPEESAWDFFRPFFSSADF